MVCSKFCDKRHVTAARSDHNYYRRKSVDTLHLEKSASVGLTKADMKGFKTHQNFLNYKKKYFYKPKSWEQKKINLELLYQIKLSAIRSKIVFMKAIKAKSKNNPRLSHLV